MTRADILEAVRQTEAQLAKTTISPRRRRDLNKHRKRLLQQIRIYDKYRGEYDDKQTDTTGASQ